MMNIVRMFRSKIRADGEGNTRERENRERMIKMGQEMRRRLQLQLLSDMASDNTIVLFRVVSEYLLKNENTGEGRRKTAI